jgi:hypothetical protein
MTTKHVKEETMNTDEKNETPETPPEPASFFGSIHDTKPRKGGFGSVSDPTAGSPLTSVHVTPRTHEKEPEE